MQIHTAGFDIKYTDRLLEAMCEGIEAKRATGILDCIGTMSWESKKIEQLYKQYIGNAAEMARFKKIPSVHSLETEDNYVIRRNETKGS